MRTHRARPWRAEVGGLQGTSAVLPMGDTEPNETYAEVALSWRVGLVQTGIDDNERRRSVERRKEAMGRTLLAGIAGSMA